LTSDVNAPVRATTGDAGRVYPIDAGTKGLLIFCAVIAAVGGFGFAGYGLFAGHGSDRLVGVASGLAMLGFAGVPLAMALKFATVLYADRIERRGPFGARAMRKIDIAGYRIIPGRNAPPYMRLTPRQAGVHALNVYRFAPDAAFDDWFKEIPDLAVADRAELEANPVLGPTPEARKVQLRRLYAISYGYMGLASVVAVWTMIWPQPYAPLIWIDVFLPLVGLGAVVWSRGGIMLIALGRTEPPQVFPGIMLAGLALVIRAMDRPIVDIRPALIGAACIGIAMAALPLLPTFGRKSIAGVLGGLVLGAIYGYGAIVTLDRVADRSPPHLHLGVVHDRYTSGSRSIAYNIAVQPYGHPEAKTIAFVISHTAYDAVRLGEKVCVGSHRGALGIPWFELSSCYPTSAQAR
jgi:hypothetical protein